MSTYICTRCGCIDNTSCGGNYWNVKLNLNSFKEDFDNKNFLCAECTPSKYKSGSTSKGGKWHHRFKKEHWSSIGTKEEVIEICKKNNGNLINAIEFFKQLKGE